MCCASGNDLCFVTINSPQYVTANYRGLNLLLEIDKEQTVTLPSLVAAEHVASLDTNAWLADFAASSKVAKSF